MDIFEFIIYQQQTYPDVALALLYGFLTFSLWFGAGSFIALLIHGWPTQRVVDNRSKSIKEAPPARQYHITGTLKDEMSIANERRKNFKAEWKTVRQWCYRNRAWLIPALLIVIIMAGLGAMF